MKWVYYTLNLSLMCRCLIPLSSSQTPRLCHSSLHPGLGLNGLLDDFRLGRTGVGLFRGRGGEGDGQPFREVLGLVREFLPWSLLGAEFTRGALLSACLLQISCLLPCLTSPASWLALLSHFLSGSHCLLLSLCLFSKKPDCGQNDGVQFPLG